MQIHDPPLIHELDHHHVLHFTYRRHSERRGRERFRSRQCAGARLCRARDLVVPRRLSAGADRGDGRGGGAAAGHLAAARRVHRQGLSRPPARRHRSGHGVLHRRRGAQQPAVPAGDLGDPRPAGLSPGRPAAGLYRSAPGAAGLAAAAAGPGLLRDPARRAVGYSELAAGDRRAQLGDRLQRPGAAAARDHRQRAPACQPAGGQGRHHHVRPRDLDRGAARLARAGERAGRARRRLCLPGLCPAQARVGARLRRRADRQAARRAGAVAAVARGRRDHRRLGGAQGHRLRARRQRGARIRDRRPRSSCPPG